ncbi:MAG: DUF1015 domain-containing protein, partial [Candidatus Omnitrophica bacterium]|nr:DUF1015 domain-containing protein [Candidatus Omnitrophota bacterium]
MAIISPFRGIFYNPEKVEDFSKVVCPPYDVISQQEQDKFYKTHPFNIIRVDYGKVFSNDDYKNNRYTRANVFFQRWQKERIIIQDKTPSLYLLAQEFIYRGKKFVRWGIICRFKL